MVAVAQSVESRIVIPVVAGSIPVGHPTYQAYSAVSTDLAAQAWVYLFDGYSSVLIFSFSHHFLFRFSAVVIDGQIGRASCRERVLTSPPGCCFCHVPYPVIRLVFSFCVLPVMAICSSLFSLVYSSSGLRYTSRLSELMTGVCPGSDRKKHFI